MIMLFAKIPLYSPGQTNRIFHRTTYSIRSSLLYFGRCCSVQGGQTNTTFRPTFLGFSELLPSAPYKSKLWPQIKWKQCELSMRESSKLGREVKRIQHFTEQHTEMFNCSPTIFDCHRIILSSIDKQSTAQQVVKRRQHFNEHECCTLLGEMLELFDHGLSFTAPS